MKTDNILEKLQTNVLIFNAGLIISLLPVTKHVWWSNCFVKLTPIVYETTYLEISFVLLLIKPFKKVPAS